MHDKMLAFGCIYIQVLFCPQSYLDVAAMQVSG